MYYVTMRWCGMGRLSTVSDGHVRLNETGRIIDDCWWWLELQYEEVLLDAYVVMPHHLHGIIAITHARRDGSRTVPTRQEPLG